MNYIVIVNWNGSDDTIECLNSLIRLHTDNIRVVICDNGSTDSSIPRIMQWRRGNTKEPAQCLSWSIIKNNFGPFEVRHPNSVRVLAPNDAHPNAGDDAFITILDIGRNLGFAGANNIGLRYALLDSRASGFWLLNNDTVVAPSALDALRARCAMDATIGMCGATLMYYHDPDIIQAAGGSSFKRVTGRGKALAVGLPLSKLPTTAEIEREMDYVTGASMFLTRAFLDGVGWMNEDYFLYFEELDWAVRCRGQFRLGFARDAVVFHKEGATIGSKSLVRPSDTSLYYLNVNALRFTKRYYPFMLPLVCTRIALDVVRGVKRRDMRSVRVLALAGLDWLSSNRREGPLTLPQNGGHLW